MEEGLEERAGHGERATSHGGGRWRRGLLAMEILL